MYGGEIYKKSYKRVKYSGTQGIPFRKCQTALEEKALILVNKIKEGKYCEKDIERFFNKLENISVKELKNKYFFSAIKVIINLVVK